MKILVIADEPVKSELLTRIGPGHKVEAVDEDEFDFFDNIDSYDAVFDLNIEQHPEALEQYAQMDETVFVVSGVKTSLAELVFQQEVDAECLLIGIADLPGMIGRDKAEISVYDESQAFKAQAFFEQLNWPCHIVKDRVGLVSPRIIFMIINEAFYTLQEGTATIEDIDSSMKLGTNYPYGPFEWCRKIGIDHVYETLEALYMDTNDSRYKVCPLLKNMYLKGVIGW